MPFWQEHRQFLTRIGAALAVVLLGFVIVMGMYSSAAAQNGENEDTVARIEILSRNLGGEEELEMGKALVLGRRWNEVTGQVGQTIQPKFLFGENEEEKKIRLMGEVVDVGGAWKEKFEKKNMNVDDSVQSLGNLNSTSVVEDVDERIARLDLLVRVLAAVGASGIVDVGNIRHEKRDVILVPGSDQVILRHPVRLEVEGTFSEVAALTRGIQGAGRFIQVGKASLKAGGDQPVLAALEVAALQVRSKASMGKTGEEGTKRSRRPRGGRRRYRE